MSIFLYNTSLLLYRMGIRLASPFHPKAKQWTVGRKGLFHQLQTDFKDNDKPVAWFHCASLGEYEQAQPLIEEYCAAFPDHRILLTFFSPSGYHAFKDNTFVDWVYYLPLDSANNATRFINLVKPSIVFFIKYEFWYHYLQQLNLRRIPTYLISGIFRENQLFFKPHGAFYRRLLSFFSHIFVQNESSQLLLRNIHVHQSTCNGDTRIDQVIKNKEQQRSNQTNTFSVLSDIPRKILVCGSTWPVDEKLIANWHQQHPEWFIIIAPHEIHSSHIDDIKSQFRYANPVLFSSYPKTITKPCNMLIIDSIGQLKYLYSFADAAYIGGGFGKGIHNILEAAIYQIPVFFGPNHRRFNEANELMERKIGFCIHNTQDLKEGILSCQCTDALDHIQKQSAQYFEHSKGASQRIIQFIRNAQTDQA